MVFLQMVRIAFFRLLLPLVAVAGAVSSKAVRDLLTQLLEEAAADKKEPQPVRQPQHQVEGEAALALRG